MITLSLKQALSFGSEPPDKQHGSLWLGERNDKIKMWILGRCEALPL